MWSLETRCLLAVQDPAVPFVSSRGGLVATGIGYSVTAIPYFNAGVMVINVEKWRRIDVSAKVMAVHSPVREGAQLL